jgi:hypothetical protein
VTASGDEREKLNRLKDSISQAGLNVVHYSDLTTMAQDFQQKMEALIERDYPVQSIPTPLERERMTHLAFQEIRSRVYIGGHKYFQQIDQHNSEPIVVVGESGSGKVRRIILMTFF